ncbi:MAG: hypothetical protein RL632_1898 [Bacteroidota bacterium]|jgi:hypothetical protein
MASDLTQRLEIKVSNPFKGNGALDLEWHEVERQIFSVFTVQFERLFPLITAVHSKICIHVNLFFDAVNEKIAAFNFGASEHGNFIFDFNVILFQSIDFEKILHETVLHEMIHALDIQVALENRAQFLASKNFILSHRKHSQSIENTFHDFSVQWAFLHFFATIRNEGVAILGSKIMNDDANYKDFNESLSFFASDVTHALGLCKNSLYHKRVLPETVQSTLKLFEHHTEEYADVLLYQLTIRQLPAYASTNYTEFLIQEKSLEEKLALISSLFDFDLSDWIRALLKDKEIENVISYDQLFLLLNAFDRERKGDSVSLNLLKHGYNCNYSAFLTLLKSCVEVIYDFEDLVRMHDSFFNETSYDDLLDDLKSLSQRIIELRDDSNSELVDLSLNYLFQKEDMIQDHSPIIGFQDDWIVLEGTYTLLLHR